jgi:hypothetical protein
VKSLSILLITLFIVGGLTTSQAGGLSETLNETSAKINEDAVDQDYIEYMKQFTYASSGLEMGMHQRSHEYDGSKDTDLKGRFLIVGEKYKREEGKTYTEYYLGALELNGQDFGLTAFGAHMVKSFDGKFLQAVKGAVRVLRLHNDPELKDGYHLHRFNYVEADLPMPIWKVEAGKNVRILFGPEAQVVIGRSGIHNDIETYSNNAVSASGVEYDDNIGTKVASATGGANILVLLGDEGDSWQVGGKVYVVQERSINVGTETYDYNKEGWELFVVTPNFGEDKIKQVFVRLFSLDSDLQSYFETPGGGVFLNKQLNLEDSGIEVGYRMNF